MTPNATRVQEIVGADTRPEQPVIGCLVSGYDTPVINEKAVRVAAGVLFLAGAMAVASALAQGSAAPLRPFGIVFMTDMALRVVVGDRWSPSLALGRLATSRSRPVWVGAPQKAFAWWLGFALAFTSCALMGFLGAPLAVTLALCGVCLTLLLLEAAFGICVGCSLQRILTTTPPQYCHGDSCAMRTDGTSKGNS